MKSAVASQLVVQLNQDGLVVRNLCVDIVEHALQPGREVVGYEDEVAAMRRTVCLVEDAERAWMGNIAIQFAPGVHEPGRLIRKRVGEAELRWIVGPHVEVSRQDR